MAVKLKMGNIRHDRAGRPRGCILLALNLALAFSTYVDQVASLPTDIAANHWPTFPRRNVAALARDGYLKTSPNSFKRGISTLAKNGQLPTFRSPYDETDKNEQDEDESRDKRNLASIARLRSYSAMKRNIQALARDGYRGGRGQTQQNDKRNIAALARNGLLIHKRDDINGDEYYYPFYQNSIPPLSEMDGPFDINEMYDLQQSINPDMFPPLNQVYKRDVPDFLMPEYEAERLIQNPYQVNDNDDNNPFYKRGAAGMPVHGLLRQGYVDPSVRNKRYILSLPDIIDRNHINVPDDDDSDIDEKRSVDEYERDNFEKRHIGSLARLGLLPSFRFSAGRYSRSGRAKVLLPVQELYRKHSPDENFGIRQYLTGPEIDTINTDNTDVQAQAIPTYTHPTGRILRRPLTRPINNIAPSTSPLLPPNYIEPYAKNNWQPASKFYYFRSLKIPHRDFGKRYHYSSDDKITKVYPNRSLPSRRKNQ